MAILSELAPATVWMPSQGSDIAARYDQLWLFLILMTTFFTVLIMGLLIAFVIRRRQRRTADRATHATGATHSTPLELTWIVVPTVVVIALFVFGFQLYLDMNQAPSNAYEVTVVAKQWDWTFQYPDGTISSQLHVPADTPIKLQLQANDVIHSFFVPAFRVKKDAVPGRYNKAWFQANWDPTKAQALSAVNPGARKKISDLSVIAYPLYCAEYCGRGHSAMLSKVVVHEDQASFRQWQAAQQGLPEDMTFPEYGRQVFNNRCSQCHVAEGKGQQQGPPWDDLFGRKEQMADGSSVEVDEQYIRDSILNPNKDIVAGYENAGAMPTFKGILKEYEITALIEYMKSISDNYQGNILKKPEEQ